MTTQEEMIHALSESPNSEKSASSTRSGLGMIGKGSLRGHIVPPADTSGSAPPHTRDRPNDPVGATPGGALASGRVSAPATRSGSLIVKVPQTASVGRVANLQPTEPREIGNRHPPVPQNPYKAAETPAQPLDLRVPQEASHRQMKTTTTVPGSPPDSVRSQLVAADPVVSEQTSTYSPELIKRLLEGAQREPSPAGSEAVEQTLVSNLGADMLIAAANSAFAVDHASNDDVTRVYRALAAANEETVASQMRPKAVMDPINPSVIVRTDPVGSNTGRWLKWGLVAVATGTVAIVLTYLLVFQQGSRSSHAPALLGADPALAAASRAGGRSYVVIALSATPPNARLRLDGAPVANPCTLQRPSDKARHVLVAEAPGYVALTRTLQFERDTTVMLGLVPAPPPEVTVTQLDRIVGATKGMGPASPKPVHPTKSPHGASQQATEQPGNPEPQKDCNPPYTVDEAGVKTYKPDCV